MSLVVHRSWSRDLDTATFYRILALRVEVFVVEQACPYLDLDGRDLEPSTRLLWVTDGEAIVATARLLEDFVDGAESYRIGRVCTARSSRGQGLADRLLTAAIAEAGAHPIRLEAQEYALKLYEGHGFVPEGDEYLEDGIPHVPMLRAPR